MSTSGGSAGPVRAGIIGLGIMGGTFARHLACAGIATSGFDLLASNIARLRDCGVHPCASSNALAKQSDNVITSLPSPAALYEPSALSRK